MSGPLRLLLGRAHTGKSGRLRKALLEVQSGGGRAILIVPEQYTYETERTLSDALGGLLGVQVLSFERLSERVLSLYGQDAPFLSAQGCRMVVGRAALLCRDQLNVLGGAAGTAGFADMMQELLSDLKRCGLAPDDLDRAADKLQSHAALSEKLSDIAAIYRDTERYLNGRYITGDDTMAAACALLPGSFVENIPVFIDEIDRPNAQLYALVKALMRTASSVTVALRVDRSGPRDADVFAPDNEICARLTELAASLGSPVFITDCAPESGRVQRAPLHLEQNLYASPVIPYAGMPAGIALYGASSRAREIEALCDAVLTAARQGVRYREMAVIVSDLSAYAFLIERAFARRGIPLFLDRKRPVTGHAAADAMLSALRAALGSFAASDVLRLCKTGYADAAQADVEELELYLKRTGLFGSALKKPFTGAHVPEGAERARAAVMGPLETLRVGCAGESVSEKVRALYDYLASIQLSNKLSAEAEALRQLGRVALMEEHAQVWNLIMELLEQLDHILGDTRVTGKLFISLIEEGLSGCAVGVIPGTADAVLVGDYARTKCRSVRALFVLGVNEGLLPAARTDDAIINDAELRLLASLGLPVWNSASTRAAMDRLDIYSAFSKATESVYISYAFTGETGELAPSPIVDTVKAIFPALRLQSDLDGEDALPLCAVDGLSMLTRDLSAFYAGDGAPARLPSLLRVLSDEPGRAALVRRLQHAAAARGRKESLTSEDAIALYAGAKSFSASRLEQFNSCAFKHFVRYGLRAADEKTYEEKAADLGSFYHAALEGFVRAVQDRQMDWKALSPGDVDALMDELLPGVIASHNDGIFLTSPRLRATLFLLVDTIKSGARAIARQIQAGDFLPQDAECRFGPGEAFPPLPILTDAGETAYLSGVIDRIDTAGVEGEHFIRVVDYKSGARKFDFGGVLDGLTLQLPLYLMAAAQAGAGRAGLYYMTLNHPVPSDEDDPAEAVNEAFRLRGLTLSDPRVLRMSDEAICGRSDVLDGVRGDGERFSGSVATGAQMAQLLEKACRIAGESVRAMRGGRIAARPMDKACEYCDYRCICGFDPSLPGCRARRKRTVGREQFFSEGAEV